MSRPMEPDLELLGALRWMIQQYFEEYTREPDTPDSVDPVDWIFDAEVCPDRARLLVEGEEDPTLTELAHVLASLGIGWAEFGRRLREWHRLRAQADRPPEYDAVRWDAREEVIVQRIERFIEERFKAVDERIRRLEVGRDEADQGK